LSAKLSIRLAPANFLFCEKFNNFTKKSKAAVYFNQYEDVYVLLKLLSYGIEDSTTKIMNLEM
jgi:hypothetical protein